MKNVDDSPKKSVGGTSYIMEVRSKQGFSSDSGNRRRAETS